MIKSIPLNKLVQSLRNVRRHADWRTARSPRAQRWLSQIASRFDAMFGDYDCLGHMSNGEGVYTKRAA